MAFQLLKDEELSPLFRGGEHDSPRDHACAGMNGPRAFHYSEAGGPRAPDFYSIDYLPADEDFPDPSLYEEEIAGHEYTDGLGQWVKLKTHKDKQHSRAVKVYFEAVLQPAPRVVWWSPEKKLKTNSPGEFLPKSQFFLIPVNTDTVYLQTMGGLFLSAVLGADTSITLTPDRTTKFHIETPNPSYNDNKHIYCVKPKTKGRYFWSVRGDDVTLTELAEKCATFRIKNVD